MSSSFSGEDRRTVWVYILQRTGIGNRSRTRKVAVTFSSFHVPPLYRGRDAARIARGIRDTFGCPTWVEADGAPAVIDDEQQIADTSRNRGPRH